MERIERILTREIGLLPASIGTSAVSAAVHERMARSGETDLDAYVTRLEHSGTERHELVEVVVVSETWFFRDTGVFRDLEEFAKDRILPMRDRHLRVLSVPCATGEEPYSAAIALLEVGLSPERYSVIGVDVSERAIELARLGIYGQMAFRSERSREMSRHFEAAGQRSTVGPKVRDRVSFKVGNVLNPHLFPASERFDVIFCRNLLIYLDAAARSQALEHLKRWLAPDGILLGGHAETIDTMTPHFRRSAGGRSYCCYSLTSPSATGTSNGHCSSNAKRAVKATVGTKRSLASTRASNQREASTVGSIVSTTSGFEPQTSDSDRSAMSLRSVAALADKNDPSATAACERHVAEHGPSAAAYYLLALTQSAKGADHAAIESLTRTLYLDPKHHSALVQLELLCIRAGRLDDAQNARRRAALARPSEGGA